MALLIPVSFTHRSTCTTIRKAPINKCHIFSLLIEAYAKTLVITFAKQWRLYFLFCWFVHLLATWWKNTWTDFHDILRICQAWYKEQSGKFGGVTFNPLVTGFLFLCFQENPCMLATLWENRWTAFHEVFSKGWTWDKEQAGTFSGCCGKPLDSRVDFPFSG